MDSSDAMLRALQLLELMWFEMERTDDRWYWAEYSTFYISDEVDNYRLTVDGYSGDAGDAMAAAVTNPLYNANNMMFSTPDRDNDACPCSCAVERNHGWWFQHCTYNSLNYDSYSIWQTSAHVYDVKTSHVLVKVY